MEHDIVVLIIIIIIIIVVIIIIVIVIMIIIIITTITIMFSSSSSKRICQIEVLSEAIRVLKHRTAAGMLLPAPAVDLHLRVWRGLYLKSRPSG